MCCDLSCYRVLHRFLTPSFVLLGASAKYRCLGKLSHPSLLSRKVKTVIIIAKVTLNIYNGRMCLGREIYCYANRKLIRLTMSPTLNNKYGIVEEH